MVPLEITSDPEPYPQKQRPRSLWRAPGSLFSNGSAYHQLRRVQGFFLPDAKLWIDPSCERVAGLFARQRHNKTPVGGLE